MSEETVKIKVQDGDNSFETNSVSGEEEEIEWQFEERPIAPKSEWLWAAAILGSAVIFFSVMLKDYLLVIIIALSAFIIYVLKNKAPEFHLFKLNDEGLHINGKIYPYDDFESFWIFPDNEIALRSKRRLIPILVVPFDGGDKSAIKKILFRHLPEIEEEESLLDLFRKKIF